MARIDLHWCNEIFSESKWNFSFVLIVLISVVGLLVIACGIVCTLKKCQLGPQPRSPEEAECPETSFSMLELSRRPVRSEENTYVVHPPNPRRPPDFNPTVVGGSSSPDRRNTSTVVVTGNTTSIRMPKQSPLLNRNPDEAPPPAYSDIFPPDYVPDPGVMRGQTHTLGPDNSSV